MKRKTQSTRKPKRSNPVYDVDKNWFFARFADMGLSLRKVADMCGKVVEKGVILESAQPVEWMRF